MNERRKEPNGTPFYLVNFEMRCLLTKWRTKRPSIWCSSLSIQMFCVLHFVFRLVCVCVYVCPIIVFVFVFFNFDGFYNVYFFFFNSLCVCVHILSFYIFWILYALRTTIIRYKVYELVVETSLKNKNTLYEFKFFPICYKLWCSSFK